MCSQSVSGSSLLSGYNEEDVRERSGRSRREFEEIDAVLYDEEKSKRTAIKKICEEWSSKPHFRIRGRPCPIDRLSKRSSTHVYRQKEIIGLESTPSSSFDILTSQSKDLNLNDEINVFLNENTSGRSSIDSIEGSELTNNSDLDDNERDDETNTPLNQHFTDASVDSFDTDEDDDDDEEYDTFPSGISNHDYSVTHRNQNRSKQPQFSIKCLKDNIVHSLAWLFIQRFVTEQQSNLQQYTKLVCERNSIKLRPKLRPYSLPPRSFSQNRYSLPANTMINCPTTLLPLTSLPFRATPEPDMKLTSLLRVTPIRIGTSGPIGNQPTSPRKPQTATQFLPSQTAPAPLSLVPTIERTPLMSLVGKPSQQSISLIGTAMVNATTQLTIAPQQVSQSSTRQSSSAWRYRSATTTTNTIVQNHEPNTRLPPINIERIGSNDQIAINRSNTISNTVPEPIPPTTRAVSGTSTGSNLSSNIKSKTLASFNKTGKPSRPITMSSINTKDFIHPSSTSPARSTTTTITPSSILRTTPASRGHHTAKRPVLTTKPPPPPPPSTVIKIPPPHIY